jgi:hypothetical protein
MKEGTIVSILKSSLQTRNLEADNILYQIDKSYACKGRFCAK